jgi:uncharacterized protein YoxC
MFSNQDNILLKHRIENLTKELNNLEAKVNELDKEVYLASYKLESINKNISNMQEAFILLSESINKLNQLK